MPKQCVAGGCTNSSGDGFRMQVWPKDPIVAEKWTQFVKQTRENWTGPSAYSLLCSAHFEEDCYFNTPTLELCGYPARRVKDAVPTIHKRIQTKPCDRGRRHDVKPYHYQLKKSTIQKKPRHQDLTKIEQSTSIPVKSVDWLMLEHNYAFTSHENKIKQEPNIQMQEPDEKINPNENKIRYNQSTQIKKRKHRKKRNLSMYGGKTKLERNPFRHRKRVTPSNFPRDEKSKILLPNHHDSKDDITMQKMRTNVKRERQSFLSYNRKTKLQRNLAKSYDNTRRKSENKQDTGDCKDNLQWIKTEPTSENESFDKAAKPDEEVEDTHATYQIDLLESLYAMQKNGKLCDLTFKVNSSKTRRQVTLKAHKLIFATISKKIRLHRNEVFEVDEELSMQDLIKIIEFAYTGKIIGLEDMEADEIGMIREAAISLDISKCVDYIDKIYLKNNKMNGEILLDKEILHGDGEKENDYLDIKPPNIDEYLPLYFTQNESDVESTQDYDTTDTEDEISIKKCTDYDNDDETPIKPKTFTMSRHPSFPSKLLKDTSSVKEEYIVID
uniref:uncharacterized protein LOC120343377 n=1 Tax=Styela clava TaxID=7725 RepID=UPI00193A8A56|nr:uncharacterized protein LOC120343377 [Styela clava]